MRIIFEISCGSVDKLTKLKFIYSLDSIRNWINIASNETSSKKHANKETKTNT